jgi:hypothetical protein
VALQLGTNVITVTARDAAGNAGQAVLSVTATDGEPPTVAILHAGGCGSLLDERADGDSHWKRPPTP